MAQVRMRNVPQMHVCGQTCKDQKKQGSKECDQRAFNRETKTKRHAPLYLTHLSASSECKYVADELWRYEIKGSNAIEILRKVSS